MDKQLYKLLKLLSCKRKFSHSELLSHICNKYELDNLSDNISWLINQGYVIEDHDNNFISITPDDKNIPETEYALSPLGRNILEEHKSSRFKFIFSEIRNWASLVIAIAAFIKSFFF